MVHATNPPDIEPVLFDLSVGIDYSGRESPTSRTPAIQVYASFNGDEPLSIPSPSSSEKLFKNWCRKEVAEWLVEQARKKIRFSTGIDHAFSFPSSYMKRYKLETWPQFLDDFCRHWPTNEDNAFVDLIRDHHPARTGSPDEFRLTDRWTSSAKSVFLFDVQGSVAKSTHTGIPWLRRINHEVGEKVHFWPFDGWETPAGKSVFVEVYPSLFRKRYPRLDRSPDQHDAYAVAQWLSEMDANGFLRRYFAPPLTDDQKKSAELEGWILGVC
jgi:hypothetical protein